MTESKAYSHALRLLGRCDRSEADLRGRLQQRDYPEAEIDAALKRCLELGYLNDERFAARLAEQLVASGRATGPRLRLELKKRGIPPALAETAAGAAEAACDNPSLLLEQLQRRYPGFAPQTAGPREKQRVVAYFQRRGFRLGEILAAIDQYQDLRTGES